MYQSSRSAVKQPAEERAAEVQEHDDEQRRPRRRPSIEQLSSWVVAPGSVRGTASQPASAWPGSVGSGAICVAMNCSLAGQSALFSPSSASALPRVSSRDLAVKCRGVVVVLAVEVGLGQHEPRLQVRSGWRTALGSRWACGSGWACPGVPVAYRRQPSRRQRRGVPATVLPPGRRRHWARGADRQGYARHGEGEDQCKGHQPRQQAARRLALPASTHGNLRGETMTVGEQNSASRV